MVNQKYLEHVLEQLSDVPNFTHKKMFGGIGFFRDNAMWGAIMNEHDSLRLKADKTTEADFEAAGCSPWQMEMRGKPHTMPYWTLPQEVISDKKLLAEWVERAATVAAQTKKK